MRIGISGARRYYTNSGAPGCAHKISTDILPMLPLFRRGKCLTFWPKFQPQSSSDHRIFELQQIIRNQKQTFQGPVIVWWLLSPYQTWGRSVPQLWEPLAQSVPEMGKSRNFLYSANLGPRHISETIRARKLKFYIPLDMVKYTFGIWTFFRYGRAGAQRP